MKLSFFQDLKAGPDPELSFGTSDLQIRGGAISGFMSSRSTARYLVNGWHYGGHAFRVLAVTGSDCLMFGTRHDLTFISDVVDHFYFIGPCLSANGVAIAKYDQQNDLWHGIERRMWCHSLRVVSPAISAAITGAGRIARLNPWEPDGLPQVMAVA